MEQQEMTDAVTVKKCVQAQKKKNQPRWNGEEILLVDEVDVFFGADFYGQSFTQVAQLEDGAVRALLRRIWSERDCKLSLREIKAGWPEYAALHAKFPNWQKIVDLEVCSMVSDVTQYNDPSYVFNPVT